jgi:histone H3/H4
VAKRSKRTDQAKEAKTLLLTLPACSAALGPSERTLRRLQAEGAIEPKRPAAGRTPALYDALAVARALIAKDDSAKDERDRAQADFVRLKIKRETGELLSKADVDRAARRIIDASRGRLSRMPDDLRDKGLAPDFIDLVDQAVREALEELAGLAAVTREVAH